MTDRPATSSGAGAEPLRLPLINWESMRLSLYWAYEARPVYAHSSHVVTSQTAWLLRRGSVRFRWRDRTLSLPHGQFIVLGTQRGEHQFSDDALLVSVCFRAEWFTGQSFFDDSSPIVLDVVTYPRLMQATDQLVRAVGRLGPPADTNLLQHPGTFAQSLRLRRAYLTWLETLAGQLHKAGVGLRAGRTSDTRVLHAVALLEDWPLEQPFDERQVAAATGLSLVHFNRLFTVELGLSAKAYFERRRFRAARERLLVDDTPIKNIAYHLGFHDAAHFCNWFRKRTGVSPSQFRIGHVQAWDLA